MALPALPDDELAEAVRGGMAKINIGTALNTAFTGTVGAALGEQPDLIDSRRYLEAARGAMADTVKAALRLLAADVTIA